MALKVTKHLQAVPSGTPEVAKVCKIYIYVMNCQGFEGEAVQGDNSFTGLLSSNSLFKPSSVLQVLALFPFFQADLSNRQQKVMRALTKAPRVMGVIGAVLGLLPMVCKRWLVNWWGGVLEPSLPGMCNNTRWPSQNTQQTKHTAPMLCRCLFASVLSSDCRGAR